MRERENQIMATKAKTIRMLLYDGDLTGVMNISDSAWESGKMYAAPRESISDLASRADCRKYGVYLLLSEQQVYVGQASDLERRTKQHLTDKAWWTRVILMTTKDDSFNASDIDYLESSLISLAGKAGKSDSDNKKKGNPQKVDEFRQAELEQYLEEALFLLELIGVQIFKKDRQRMRQTNNCAIPGETTTPPQAIVTAVKGKPPLPDLSLGPCAFAKTALKSLLDAGYIFTDEQMKQFSSIDGSKQYTKRNLPLFWILRDGDLPSSIEKNIRSRYWNDVFISGKYRFLMFSQWYEKKGATKEHLIEWYSLL